MTRQFVSSAELYCRGHMDWRPGGSWVTICSKPLTLHDPGQVTWLSCASLNPAGKLGNKSWTSLKTRCCLRVEHVRDKQIIKALITAALEQKPVCWLSMKLMKDQPVAQGSWSGNLSWIQLQILWKRYTICHYGRGLRVSALEKSQINRKHVVGRYHSDLSVEAEGVICRNQKSEKYKV